MSKGNSLDDEDEGRRRRRYTTQVFSRSRLFLGGSDGCRLGVEAAARTVHLYGPALLAATCMVLGLNVLDSLFTILHLQQGGLEVNPVMRWLLRYGQTSFIFWKSIVVGLSLVVLCHPRHLRFGRVGIGVTLGGYLILLLYHISLVSQA